MAERPHRHGRIGLDSLSAEAQAPLLARMPCWQARAYLRICPRTDGQGFTGLNLGAFPKQRFWQPAASSGSLFW